MLIVNTVKNFQAVQPITIGSLNAQTFEIDVNYSVDSNGTIELSPTIGSLGLDGSYALDHQVTQTIQLHFKINKNK